MSGSTKLAHGERKHSSVVGGSSAGRVLKCPGSVELSSSYPDTGSSPFAEEGTALHEAVEFILDGQVTSDDEIVGLSFNDHTIDTTLHIEAVAPALDLFDTFLEDYEDFEFLQEQRVHFPGIDGAFGLGDIFGAGRHKPTGEMHSVVWDWKFGAGVPVYAENLPQGNFYAAAGANTEETARFFNPAWPVIIAICQPRIEEVGLSVFKTSVKQIGIFAKELQRAVEIAKDPLIVDTVAIFKDIMRDIYDPDQDVETLLHEMKGELEHLNSQFSRPVFAEGDHCRWCRGKPGCPLKNMATNQALIVSDEDTEDQLGYWLGVADTVEDWVASVRSLAHQRLEAGLPVKGYKLIAKRAYRKWVDEDQVYDHFKRMRSIKEDEFAPRKLLSPAQVEKVLKTKKLLKKMPEALVTAKSSGTTMAPDSDKSPAVMVAGSPAVTAKLAQLEDMRPPGEAAS